MKEYNFNAVYNGIYSTTIMAKNKEDAFDLFLREFEMEYGEDADVVDESIMLNGEDYKDYMDENRVFDD